MSEKISDYKDFVDYLTSDPSKNFDAYIESLTVLRDAGCDIARLDTAATGMCSEAGEIMEVVKKLKFQGKVWNDDERYHLKREAGDLLFYWMNACIALGHDPFEIIDENISKLEKRYPNGFDAFRSENRAPQDI